MPIEPAFLDELARLEGSLRRETDARQQGTQRSPNVGEGLTFSDYRRYTPGDDVRLVDWRVYARTDEYFIKQYEAERNLTVHVLLDTSASMDFGEGSANKFEFAARFGLAFAYFAATQHDSFRFSALGTGVAMVVSLFLLARAVRDLPIGTAYAVWTGIGAVGTALVGIAVFDEPATLARLGFISVIVFGIVGLHAVSGSA